MLTGSIETIRVIFIDPGAPWWMLTGFFFGLLVGGWLQRTDR